MVGVYCSTERVDRGAAGFAMASDEWRVVTRPEMGLGMILDRSYIEISGSFPQGVDWRGGWVGGGGGFTQLCLPSLWTIG